MFVTIKQQIIKRVVKDINNIIMVIACQVISSHKFTMKDKRLKKKYYRISKFGHLDMIKQNNFIVKGMEISKTIVSNGQ